MAKYLYHGTYTDKGLQGLMKEGGSKRVEVTERAIESLGGTMESYHFAFGGSDFYIIVDIPDHASAVAGLIIANASGVVSVKTAVLLTPAEIDAAVQKTVDWTPPGK